MNLIKFVMYDVFCDMDGVLCDFDGQFKKLTGSHPFVFDNRFGKTEFWRVIHEAGVEFWSTMDWCPGGYEIWDLIKDRSNTACVLTRPSKNRLSRTGKKRWADKNLGGNKHIVFSPGPKSDFIKGTPENNILIDDYSFNLTPWLQNGGVGLLHKDPKRTLMWLRKNLVK